jgi:hypothetical protein
MTNNVPQDKEIQWISDFVRRHGRPPRVLHIGNIANNAYNNVKLLNDVGLDCDVMCYDYYHLMGCPEWEDADFDDPIEDQFFPDWSKVDLHGFSRPRWFAQGPSRFCIKYLLARREGKRGAAAFWWLVLKQCWNRPKLAPRLRKLKQVITTNKFRISAFIFIILIAFTNWDDRFLLILLIILVELRYIILNSLRNKKPKETITIPIVPVTNNLTEQFVNLFPSRLDKLKETDILPYQYIVSRLTILFKHYDIIQGYATDPILPMLAGHHPYVGFEHGTLRAFTLCPEPLCRLVSLAYRLADAVFITNGDCLEYAQNLGIENYLAMLHPVNEKIIRSIKGNYKKLHKEYGVRYLLLCTIRHDWKIKGTDQYIRALPGIIEAMGGEVRMIATEWGLDLQKSKDLASELGVSEFIHWIKPLPKRKLIAMMKSVDALCDQIALPNFGATAPEGIACEVPVIMSYDPASTAWIIPEPAPVLVAWNHQEIVECVKKVADQQWVGEYKNRARLWINKWHNTDRVIRTHLEVYHRVLEKYSPAGTTNI